MCAKIISFLIFVVLCNPITATYAQNRSFRDSTQSPRVALFVLNSTIIANESYAHLESRYFQDDGIAETYEGNDGPGILKSIPIVGMINMSYAGPITSKSFVEIGNTLGLHGPLIFVLDGRRLSDAQATTLRMTPEAIGQMQIDRKTLPMHTIVNIKVAKYKEPVWPPSTVWVR